MKITWPLKIILLILSLAFFPSQNYSSDKFKQAEKHYQQAVLLYKNGDRYSALNHLKKAISLNRKLSKAYNKLALIYMDDGSVHGRFKATFEMEQAVKLEPNNLEFRYNYAILNMKKGLTFEAKRQFKKIIEADPYHFLSYFHLASLEEENVMHYKNMISVDPAMDGIIFMQSFANKAQQKAADYYKQAISANPKFSDAYYRLALLYYEFSNFNEMIQLLESAVKIMPKDKNCHLFLGFAYQNVQQFENAAKEYRLAKSLMRQDELKIIESIEPILSPSQTENLQTIDQPFNKKMVYEKFWKSKDPFYLTEFNERKLEHFSRMAYANLRFSFPEKGIEGWQTDRGKVFIRYGHPQYKYRTRPYIGTYMGTTRNPLHHSKEYWMYPDFHFIFEDQYLSGNYAFAWEDGSQPDYKFIYEEMIKNVPDFYQVFTGSEMFQLPLEIAAFKGSNGKTELEICYGIPAEKIHPERGKFHLKQGLFFFDESWETVVDKTSELSLQKENLIELNKNRYGIQRLQTELDPGNYNFALEFMDKNSEKCAAVHKDVVVDTFYFEQFQISDVLFAHYLEPPITEAVPSRADFRIIPNPLRIYEIEQPIVIHYEIYNLSQDNAGDSRYSVEYKIGLDSDAIPTWKKFLTDIKLMKKKGEVTSSYEYLGNPIKEIQYQKILLPQDLVGEIKLIVEITDLISGERIQKQELITVTDKTR